MSAFVLDVNLRIKDVIGLQQVQQKIAGIQGQGGATATAAGVGAGASTAQATQAAAAQAAAFNNAAKANQNLAQSSNSANAAINKTTQATKQGAKSAENFSQSIFLAGKRYTAFVAATAIPFAAIGIFREAVQSVIEFDEALTRVRQITGQTAEQIGGLRQRFLDLSLVTGTSATELANVARTLAQAGIRGAELEDALSQLAKVPLTPTFGSIESAIEGLLAVQNQFESEALDTAQVFDVLTAVGNEFAATAEDLFAGFARGGAAFEAIGGTFEEFASVLAVVRQETRESASTVGTFFKTLSSRLADPQIQEFLRGRGISLVGDRGEFIGAIPAIRRIAEELENLDDVSQKVDIATRVSGRRQVSRFLALVSSIDEVERALNVAASANGEFNRVAEEGLTTLQNRIDRVVAQFNNLFQTLAEPVFVPFIEALTSTASAAASLVEFLSPVIPIFTQIIGFGVGIKALTFSITSLTKAAAALSAIRFAGLSGLLGGLGGAGSAAGTATGTASGLGGAGATAGIVAANAALGNLTSTVTNLIKSQVGQIAILGTTIGLLGSFSDEIRQASGATGDFVATLIRNLSILAIGGSFLSGQAPAQLFANVFSSLRGALLGVSGILATAVFTASRQAEAAIQESVSAAASRIRELDLRTGDLEDAVAQLGRELVNGVRESASNFGDLDTGEQTFGQFAQGLGKLIADTITGQRGLTDELITDEQVNDIIDNLLGDKGEQAGVILQRAIEEFGTDFRQGLVGILSETFGGTEQAIELANRLVQRIIESQGQRGLATAFNSAAQARREAAERAIAEQAQEVATRLRRIEIPTALSSELTALTEAVRRTVTSIDSNIQAFNSLSSSIGRIAAPNISFDVTQRAVEGLIQNQEAFSRLASGAFGDLSEETRNFLLLKDALTDLSKSAVAAQAQFETTGIQDLLSDPQADPSQFISQIVDNFISASEDLPPGVVERLRAVGQRVISKSLEDTVFNPEIIEDALKDVAGNVGNIFDQEFGDLGEQVGSLLEASLRQAQLQLQQQSLALETLAQRTRPEDVAQNIGLLADELRGIVSIPIPDLRFGNIAEQITEVAIAVGSSDQFFNAFEQNARQQAEALSQLSDGSAENASVLLDAIPAFVEARTNLNNLRAAANEFVRGIDDGIQRLDQTDPGFLEQRRGLERLKQEFTQALNEIEARSAIGATARTTPEGQFSSAVDIFGENVRQYQLATNNLVQALKIPLTADRARQEVQQTPPELRNIFDISAGGVQDVRIVNGQEIFERVPQQEQQAAIDLNRAAFGVEDPQVLLELFQREIPRLLESARIPESFPEESREIAARGFAATEISERVIRGLREGGQTGNLENIEQNIRDLLLGVIEDVSQARIDQPTREELGARRDFRAEEARASAQRAAAEAENAAAARARAEVAAQAAETGLARRELQQPTQTDQVREVFINDQDLESIRQSLQQIPRDQVIDIPSREDINIEDEDLDLSNIEASLSPITPAINELTNSINQFASNSEVNRIENIPSEAQESFIKSEDLEAITSAIERIPQNQVIDIPSGDGSPEIDFSEINNQLSSASEINRNLSTSVDQLAAVIDVQKEVLQNQNTNEIANVTSELASANKLNTDAINQTAANIEILNERLSENIAQSQSQQQSQQNIEIEGLDEASEATSANTETLASNRQALELLNDALSRTRTALEEGVSFDLETLQNIQIDVRGLEDAFTELRPQLEELIRTTAQDQVRLALRDIASRLGNAELSQTFENSANA